MNQTRMSVKRGSEEFERAVVKLGFMPGELEGRKVVQLTFVSPERKGKIVYRIPFVSDETETITLLVHEADFFGEWAGAGVPDSIREQAFSKLCELIGVSGDMPDDRRGQGEQRRTVDSITRDSVQAGAVNGVMAQDEHDLVRLGKEMKAMKTNSELEQEGMVPDPIQS
ncbi:hypothetical protein [Paenibacillus sp. GYB003]|uniref:hypothetical protein n=1 Tax=Paenibacillus sp. GYB003 TaxID=2994392 RepID=UPI002F9654E1